MDELINNLGNNLGNDIFNYIVEFTNSWYEIGGEARSWNDMPNEDKLLILNISIFIFYLFSLFLQH